MRYDESSVRIRYQVTEFERDGHRPCSQDLGEVALYIGTYDRLVDINRLDEFMRGTERTPRCWGISTPLCYAIKQGFSFTVVKIVREDGF